MTFQGWALIALFVAATAAMARPMGTCLFALYDGRVGRLARVDRGLFRVAGIDPQRDQQWAGYATAVLAFNLVGFLFLYAILRLQYYLPLNPQGFAGMPSGLAFNTAISFVTNTNWQNYSLQHILPRPGLTTNSMYGFGSGRIA
jgi:K+-transporting ATPase ATPase A chain